MTMPNSAQAVLVANKYLFAAFRAFCERWKLPFPLRKTRVKGSLKARVHPCGPGPIAPLSPTQKHHENKDRRGSQIAYGNILSILYVAELSATFVFRCADRWCWLTRRH